MIYAGIGSRQTPPDIIKIMHDSAILLAKEGYVCNTGAALGADQAFAQGAVIGGGVVDLKLPWSTYEEKWISSLRVMSTNVITTVLTFDDKDAYNSVTQLHPAAAALKQAVMKLHARNYLIIQPAKFVICWTPEGKEVGGTGQGIRIANMLGITIYNLGNAETLTAFKQHLGVV